MMSVAKGISATAIGMLCDRGLIDLSAPMARYWPEFARNGKQDITVTQALSHLAGIPVTDAANEGDIYDYDAMTAAIARQEPLWKPGTTQVYHSATLGHLAGMLVRAVTGQSIGQFIRREISDRLDADYFIGLTPEEESRCATMIPSANNLVGASKRAPKASVAYRQWQALPADEDFNSHQWRAAEIPAVNGHGTARGVARIYGALALGGALDGVTLMRRESLSRMLVEQRGTNSENSDVGDLDRMAIGFRLNSPPHRPMGPHMSTFGHSGAGGSQAFADPDSQLGFCYCCNRMHDGRDIGMRALSLIESTFASLDDNRFAE
jgi:CubicO group peptidase (beta-lactamase class C family)